MSKYRSEDIQVLEGLDPVRKRPGMYIGSTSSTGLHHLLWEILDNCVDEALNEHCDTIEVTLDKDHGVTIKDNGRGIPVDPLILVFSHGGTRLLNLRRYGAWLPGH